MMRCRTEPKKVRKEYELRSWSVLAGGWEYSSPSAHIKLYIIF